MFRTIKIALILIFSICSAGSAWAICKSTFMNPITDVALQEIYPIRIAGVMTKAGGVIDPPDPARSTLCICPAPPPVMERVGMPVSFWEPTRLIEVVKDPYCFPSIGTQMKNSYKSGLVGGKAERAHSNQTQTSAQVHYLIFPLWGILDILVDFMCSESGGFDMLYLSEVDPLHQDDSLGSIINPEALLFANPIAQMSCMVDSITSNLGYPLAPLFWCMGSFGSAYPLTGHISDENLVQGSAGLASRIIYKLGRTGILLDTALNLCFPTYTPIWVKWNYKLQIAKPIRGAMAFPIGRSSILWGAAKNPGLAAGSDNFVYVLFKKRACCAF